MIGKRLEELRKESGLTLEKIEEKIEISYQAYRKMEKDICNPKLETLIKICEMYNVSADYILGLTNNKTKTEERSKNE